MHRTRPPVTAARRAFAVALVVATALAAAGCSSSKGVTGASTTSVPTASSAPTATSTPAESLPPTTAVATTAPTPAPTAPAPTPAPGGSGGSGAVLPAATNLQATPGGGVTLPGTFSCGAGDPGIPGWTVADCQEMPSYADGVTTLVLRRNDDGRFGVVVLFSSGGSLVQRFRAEEEGPGVWNDVVVQLGDFNGDDGAEVWIGYRYDGSGGYLDLDVLDPRPDGSFLLGGLQSLDHGVADMHPGGATVQQAVYAASDPGCCPSSVRQREISFSGGQWRVTAGSDYPSASAPVISGDF